MRRCLPLLLVMSALVVPAFSQTSFLSYYELNDLSFASPGALRYGLYGYENPALLSTMRAPDLSFSWSDPADTEMRPRRWGLFGALPHFSVGMVRTYGGGVSVMDYRITASGGNRSVSGGFGFGWSTGDDETLGRSSVVTLGLLGRPSRYVSVGFSGILATSGNDKEGVLELAARPLGTELITVFGDYGLQQGQRIGDGAWSTGAVLEALPGLRLTGRYFETKAFSVGLEISVGRAAAASQMNFANGDGRNFTTYTVRAGGYDRNIVQPLRHDARYVDLELTGPVRYQRFAFFDDSQTLAGILEAIDAAKHDESIAGIAINASGMEAGRTMLWEIREKLRDFKATGKRVVVFVDRPGINEYHFASVADRIVLDPTGVIGLEGFLMGRTFLKGTLEKIGVGFEELRYFKYKSANEPLSRDAMSEADREQRQALVDDYYQIARRDICAGRGFAPEAFDRMVNDDLMFMPGEALAKGLVDSIGRWEEVKNTITTLEGEKKAFVGAASLERFNLPYDNRWGEPPRVALIYALGVCAMDEGIRARSLVKDVEKAAADEGVKAIVLRVDSPGGDAMASDYIAEALRKAKAKKPVIVSQGAVAASGGYWLSMDADTIVATPGTVTGSIGVIGGWMYNKELKEYLGMTTDHVKAGKHADLGFGFRLPLLGIGLPDRNLNADERAKVERMIRKFYQEFVGKVAVGRRTDNAAIEAIAQGRVWSGMDGKENGLVDVLGGMDTALEIARLKAGLAQDDLEIIESPRPGLFDFSQLFPGIPGMTADAVTDPMLDHLLFRLRHNGEPLPVLPLDMIEGIND